MGTYEHIVIGAGIVGSCTAWQLTKKGRKVLLIEQFALPHTRGSSHGPSRLIRSCYESACYAAIMPDACSMWKQLEQESGHELIVRTGVICMSASREKFNRIRTNMDAFSNGGYSLLSSADAKLLLPMMEFPEDRYVLLDKTGGIILANRALAAVQALFKENGGSLVHGCPVRCVDVGDSSVSVIMEDGCTWTSPSLIVCAGAWTPDIFKEKHLDLSKRLRQVLKGAAVDVYYWKCRNKLNPREVPCFMDSSVYGLSPFEYPGMMKVTMHGGSQCDPDSRDQAIMDPEDERRLQKYVKQMMPGLEPDYAIKERCMYTVTPDEDFVVDHLSEHKHVLLGCGFSGTGFKTAPVIGKLLSEMALGEPLSHDISSFKLSRFSQF